MVLFSNDDQHYKLEEPRRPWGKMPMLIMKKIEDTKRTALTIYVFYRVFIFGHNTSLLIRVASI